MHAEANKEEFIVFVQSRVIWAASQAGQIILAVGLLSLPFNYAYRFLVDWSVSSPAFYLSTMALALIAFLAFRWDYVLVNRYSFGRSGFTIHTLLGGSKTYPAADYAWVPALHKTINFPENRASLSFNVRDAKTRKDVRNYSWLGFSKEDFKKVSMFYGYGGEKDFSQKDFGRP